MKDLALACNPAIEDLLITSRRTVVWYIASNYNLYRAQIRESLSTAITPIHISSDLWTSPHRHALFAVCTQWVDCDYQLQNALLALPECRFNHSGHKQASLILQTLEAFDIQSRLGYHTGDNATSNDSCIEVLESKLLSAGLNSTLNDAASGASVILLIFLYKPSSSRPHRRLFSRHLRL